MKPPAAPPPPQQDGARYWRGLEDLTGAPAPSTDAGGEFPQGASEGNGLWSRREFLALLPASLLLAGGLSGCRRPEEMIYPFARMPEGFVQGEARFYATAMPSGRSALPLLVRSNEGRPTHIQGNPAHPSGGGADAFAQASILGLYDPDRSRRCLSGGKPTTQAVALEALSALGRAHRANGGRGLWFLMEPSSSPSRARLQAEILRRMPQARFLVYEPVDHDIHRRAATLAAGRPALPWTRWDQARVILSLDCDFLGAERDSARHTRGFAAGRRLEKSGDPMSRLYAVEPVMTLTGLNADHRLRVTASGVLAVAAALGAALAPQFAPLARDNPLPANVRPEWIAECAKDLAARRGSSLVLAGHRQPMAVHLLAHALNQLLENTGRSACFLEPPPELPPQAPGWPAGETAATLVILGGNPAYDLPGGGPWRQQLAQAGTIVRLGAHEDETSALAHWHLPAAHYLESWGDARTSDGVLTPIQPLIHPLFDGLTELEVLARLAGIEPAGPHAIVQETFRSLLGPAHFEERWRQSLHDGFVAGTAARAFAPSIQVARLLEAAAAAAAKDTAARVDPGPHSLEVIFHRDSRLDDGRHANNGWLQELPDPVTKLVWDNAVLVSRRTARDLGLKNEQIVQVRWGGRSVEGPVWIQPGQADNTLGLALGYGRQKAGRIANFNGGVCGFDAQLLRPARETAPDGAPIPASVVTGATLIPTARTWPLACVQSHWSMEGRAVIREAAWTQFTKDPEFARRVDPPPKPDARRLYPNPLDTLRAKARHQWAMSVDLNACTGCAVCVLACQSENNIPIVGKDQVRRGREMHWLRIDRYYSGDPALQKDHREWAPDDAQTTEAWIDDPQAAVMPMMCQHCEAAPCENVCPANATVHDDEGLNVMAYNRCVGTRYCSNNCPYKVRRFNFFDYNKRPLEKLGLGPLASRPRDETQMAELGRNPGVTVRMRGVMEKCTFCIQRLAQAKTALKIQAGDAPPGAVPDGAVQTACEQACPAGAIVFGNLADPASRVYRLKALPRDYPVLGSLGIGPRTTYLARVRNPNPAMPGPGAAPKAKPLPKGRA